MHTNREHKCSESYKSLRKKTHLMKNQRFPRLFKDVSRILRDIKDRKGNIKTVLYSTRHRGLVFKKVYALTYNVFKNLKLIDKIIKKVGLLIKEPSFNQEAAEILVHEICFSKKPLPGQSKPVLIIQKYQEVIEKMFLKYSSVSEGNLESEDSALGFCQLPRYARIHTLLTNTGKVISELKKLGFQQIEYEGGISLEKYHMMVKHLRMKEFLIDFHFKEILVFSCQQNLSDTNLFQKGHLFLQDKSSYIPVHLLAPPPGSIVFDGCAAPGMKAVHIAACMNNSGKIYATDRNEKRFRALKGALKIGGVKICKASCIDFLKINPETEPYSSVEYILLDPSCTGSGMVSRMSHITDDQNSNSEGRLQKLAGIQILLLKHALSFPSVKRIVYSTCSVHVQENEYVVHEVLQHYSDLFNLVPAFPEWPAHGIGDYEFAHLCLRASPEISLTNGFFVAVFERIGFLSQDEHVKSHTDMKKCKSGKVTEIHRKN